MPSTGIDSIHLATVSPPHPTGAPVLCMHGLFAGSWAFDGLLPLIAARGYPASAVSYRGHPPNAPISDVGRQSIADFARDASIAARTLDRPIVVGHSLGGLIALMLARLDLVRAVVLVSPAPPRGINAISPTVLSRMPRYLPAMLFSRSLLLRDGDFDTLVLNRILESERAAVRARFVPDSGRALRQAAFGVVNVPQQDIRAPMLVVGADDDRFIPLRVARKVAAKYRAPLHVAQDHGHFLFGEPGWEKQAKIVLDWIDALPSVIRQPMHEGGASAATENPALLERVSPEITHHPQPGST